jgi:hypothetical protein
LRTGRDGPNGSRSRNSIDEIASPHCQPPRLSTRHRSGSNCQIGSGQNGAWQCPLCAISGHRQDRSINAGRGPRTAHRRFSAIPTYTRFVTRYFACGVPR